MLVHAEEGLDELGLSGPSMVTEFDAKAGDVRSYRISPGDVGLAAAPGALAGGDVVENTRITLAVLSGESGPRRDVTLINAGAGIYAAKPLRRSPKASPWRGRQSIPGRPWSGSSNLSH